MYSYELIPVHGVIHVKCPLITRHNHRLRSHVRLGEDSLRFRCLLGIIQEGIYLVAKCGDHVPHFPRAFLAVRDIAPGSGFKPYDAPTLSKYRQTPPPAIKNSPYQALGFPPQSQRSTHGCCSPT